MKNYMKLEIPALSENEPFARSAVAAFCVRLNPSLDELSDVKTAVIEAVTNCIIHGYKDSIGIIYIVVKLYENRQISVKIRDKGCGIADVQQAMEPLFTTGGEERAGLGFAVMQSFTDKLTVTSKVGKGTTVTMRKYFSRRLTSNEQG